LKSEVGGMGATGYLPEVVEAMRVVRRPGGSETSKAFRGSGKIAV